VEDRPRIHVLNKIDLLKQEDARQLGNHHPHDRVFTSAATGAGLDQLLAEIDSALPIDPLVRLRLRMPIGDGRHMSIVNARGRVLHSELEDGHLLVDAELPQSAARSLREFVRD
jgi:50S ribosomal subunit-associated GTPase HflX